MTDPAACSARQHQRKEVRRKEQHMLNIKRRREARGQDRWQRKLAVIYLSEVNDDEADRIKVPSIDVQRQFCHYEAKELDAEVVGEFVDVAGTSPLPGRIGLLDRLAKKPRLDFLIVYSLDRLVPEREGAFIIGRHLGTFHTTLVSWVHAYESAIKEKKIAG